MIPSSPGRNISLPKIEQTENGSSRSRKSTNSQTMHPRYRVFVLTGAYTGLRPGELAALRVDRLDLLRRQLRVEEPIKTAAAAAR